ncbi:MAG: exopolysaccharide biosynthesis protein [Myxococcales bacterium]|nr:exopolysaccharide biosynthesis protein [Myxococcales bacterium]
MTGDPESLRISAPAGLRLSSLLAELATSAEARQTEAAATATDVTAPAVATISPGDPVVIDARDGLTIAEILDATASAGFGFVIALLALTAIPFFGMSTPFGLAIAFVGAQLVVGRARPWLPARIRRVTLTVTALRRIGRWLTRTTGWMAHLVRERLSPLTRGPGLALVGLGVVVLGLGLALPLPIPGSNMVFIVPILAYAIGLLERDGLLTLLGHAMTLAHIVLAFTASQVLASALAPIGRWLGL